MCHVCESAQPGSTTDPDLIGICEQDSITIDNGTATNVLLFGNHTQECSLTIRTAQGSWLELNIDANITGLDYFYIDLKDPYEDDRYMTFSGQINGCAMILETSQIVLNVRTDFFVRLQSTDPKTNSVSSLTTTTNAQSCGKVKNYERVIECESRNILPGQRRYLFEIGVEAICNPPCPSNCSCTLYQSEINYECPDGSEGSFYVIYPHEASLAFFTLVNSELTGLGVDAFALFPRKIHIFDLTNNKLNSLLHGTFQGMIYVQAMFLAFNNIEVIEPGVFEDLGTLQMLFLQGNQLVRIPESTFFHKSWLMMLNLKDNKIRTLGRDVFRDQPLLRHLDLSRNNISALHQDMLNNSVNLYTLNLNYNSLSTLPGGFFKNGGSKLFELYLHNNSLTRLKSSVFEGLTSLHLLTLDANKLQWIDPLIWRAMPSLATVNISRNNIYDLRKHSFDNMSHLESLDLQYNNIRKMDRASFTDFHNSTSIYVDDVPACCFTGKSKCIPRNPRPPFKTCERLMPYKVLRFFMWILGFGSLFGNLFVIFWRCLKRKESKIQPVQRAIIINLAVSDLLMGLYLLIIISADTHYGIYFPLSSEEWRTGNLCKFAGIVAITSSEASVFFVTLISIDRFLGVLFPFKQYRISQRRVAVLITIMWIASFLLGAIPTLLENTSNKFYEMSQTCIGLPLVRQPLYKEENVTYLQDWTKLLHQGYGDLKYQFGRQSVFTVSEVAGSTAWMYYSIAVFLGLNFICCTIIFLCYLSIFLTVRKTTVCVGRYKERQSEELTMAIKMAVIVLTDFFCWMPVILLGILVQTGTVTLSPNAYAWIAVFVLPINSAVNPFLYTLVTVVVDKFDLKRRRSSGYGSIPFKTSQTRRTTINSTSKDVSMKDASIASNGAHSTQNGVKEEPV